MAKHEKDADTKTARYAKCEGAVHAIGSVENYSEYSSRQEFRCSITPFCRESVRNHVQCNDGEDRKRYQRRARNEECGEVRAQSSHSLVRGLAESRVGAPRVRQRDT